jgi:hypothetical protein
MPDITPFLLGIYDSTLKDVYKIVHSKESQKTKLEEIKRRIAKDFSSWDIHGIKTPYDFSSKTK